MNRSSADVAGTLGSRSAQAASPDRQRWHQVFPVALGCAITLALGGYQFGQSNHTVYLLDALRRAHPELLANDWFTTQTLQYHALFGFLTRALVAAGIVEPMFLVGYVALVAALHVAWRRITALLGEDDGVYLVSVVLAYLCANATALGMYQFLQDSALLPSNVASVALLWGLYGRIARRRWVAASGFAVAGAFHLNYAVIGVGLWVVLDVVRWWRSQAVDRGVERTDIDLKSLGDGLLRTPANSGSFHLDHNGVRGASPFVSNWVPTMLALAPALFSIGFGLWAMADGRPRMPLGEFVDVYVRLRHPHHYDPSSWPIQLWVAFLLPIPLAAIAWWRRRGEPAWGTVGLVFAMVGALTVVSLVGAGVWYVSERLVQLSLMRFTVYLQLFACIGTALAICHRWPLARVVVPLLIAVAMAGLAFLPNAKRLLVGPDADAVPVRLSALLFAAGVLLAVGLDRVLRPHAVGKAVVAVGIALALWLGWERDLLGLTPLARDAEIEELCAHVRDHTLIDAVFIVPPDDLGFRLHARRATIVNFKGVPQLSSELPEWRRRMEAVLALQDLRALPRPLGRTQRAMRDRYGELTADQFLGIAQAYDARYLIATRELNHPRLSMRKRSAGGRYVLYHVHG